MYQCPSVQAWGEMLGTPHCVEPPEQLRELRSFVSTSIMRKVGPERGRHLAKVKQLSGDQRN